MDQAMKERIDSMFSRWQQGVCPGGQLLIAQGGTPVYARNFGYANVETKVKVSDDSVFHVASVSKQFTVAAIMKLQELGQLALDDDVRAHIPELIAFDEPVTIRQLCNNTSGVRDLWTLLMLRGVRIDDTITMDDAVGIIRRQRGLNFPPQSRYVYSNANFVLLAKIVEKLSGQTLNEFLRAHIFAPLKMNSTVVREKYWQRIDNRAQSYHDNGADYQHAVLNFGAYGATSLHTTAHDLLRWLREYHAPSVLSQASLDEMRAVPVLTTDAFTDYAAGLRVTYFNGHRVTFHSGVDAGFRAVVMHIDDLDYDLIGLSNTQNTIPLLSLTTVAKLLCGEALSPLPELPSERVSNASAVGYYYAPLPDALGYDVMAGEDGLLLRDLFDPMPLHWEGNRLRCGRLNASFALAPAPHFDSEGTRLMLQKADDAPLSLQSVAPYLGRYHSDELVTDYEVLYRDGQLVLSHFRNGDVRLYPLPEADTFIGGTQPCLTVRFIRDGDAVPTLTLSTARLFDLPLYRA